MPPRPQVRRGAQPSPVGRFAASAWLAVQVMAHNLARWAARIGLGEQLVTTKTLRRRFFSIAGRLTHTARRLTCIFPSAGPGKTSSVCPGPIARHSPASLGAPSAPDPSTGQPQGLSIMPAQPASATSGTPRAVAGRRHCRPPPGHWRGHRPLPSTPSIRARPVRLPVPITPVSTPPPYRWMGLGMGYDKPPRLLSITKSQSVVHYYQQVGRAGRALDQRRIAERMGIQKSRTFLSTTPFRQGDEVSQVITLWKTTSWPFRTPTAPSS